MNRRDFTLKVLGLAGAAATLPACAVKSSNPPITGVDSHAHVFHRGLPFIPNRRYTPDYDATGEQYLAVLDAHGISNGVVIPISILGTYNDYTVQAIAAARGRLRGLAIIDPEKDIDKLAALDRAGIVGIRLNLIGLQVPDVKSGTWRELLAVCRKLDWQIEVYDDAERLPRTVTPLVDAGAKVVVDHFGKPSVKLGVEDPGFRYLLGLGATRQVWVKLSAPYRSSNAIAAAAAPMLLKSFGPERLVWGSDWPFTGFEGKVNYAELRAMLNTWVPDPGERRMILVDTPAKLFRFTD
jgi:predicted TIM-barrel fold metal-dependent hydrolase